jgi:hypothetical protein
VSTIVAGDTSPSQSLPYSFVAAAIITPDNVPCSELGPGAMEAEPRSTQKHTVRVFGSTGARNVEIPFARGGLPEDPRMPALAAVATRGIARVLTELGVSEAVGEDVALLKYHAGSRCTFYVPTTTGGVAVKAYARDPGPVVDVLRRLAKRGLASGVPPTVAPLVAWDATLRLVVTKWFGTPSAGELVASARGARAGELAAAWLRRTVGLREHADYVFSTETALRHARSRARIIGRLDAQLGAKAQSVVAELAHRAPAGRPMALSHGSLYAAHVFDLGTGPGVIDWDRFRLAAPELDAGMFEATLIVLSLDPRHADEARTAIDAFQRGIEELVDAHALSWHKAAALLSLVRRIAGRQEGDWRRVGGTLLAEAASAAA